MNKKHLTILLFAVTMSACGDSASEGELNQDLAPTKGKPFLQESHGNGKKPADLSQNSQKPSVAKNHLPQMMANRDTDEGAEQNIDQEELEQYRQDYAQAVDVEDKAEALTALVQADEENAVPLLKEAYASPEAGLRKEAVMQMQDFSNKKEVVDLLLKALDDPDTDVVTEAIEALSTVESKRVIEALKQVAKSHADEQIRELAQDYVDQADDSAQ